MAGVVEWRPISCQQMEHTRVAPERLSLRSHSSKNHDIRHIGHSGRDDNFIWHSLKLMLQPKARQYVLVKAHNEDIDESGSSEFAHEDNGIISRPSHREEGNQLRALESYFSKLYSAQQLCFLPEKNKQKNGLSSPNEVIVDNNVDLRNRIDSLQVQFGRGKTGKVT